jgi:hypothetical protein
MENKRLTLENVEEIGLELLKEENGNSDELSVYYNYDEEIMKETMEEVREIKKANEYETLYDAFEDYLSEVNFDYIDDLKDNLVDRTLKYNSDYPYESEEYQELFDKAVEIVEEKFSINVNTNDILKNTRVRDVAVILSPNDNENFYLSNFNISEEFRDDVPQDSPMFFLIQSQGYEVEDLYDDEKVEKSPFLKSLSKEVKGFYEDVKIGFYTNMNLRDLIDLEETKQNIIIPKSTESDLVLEKEIVISRDKVKIYSDYSEEQEESNYTIGGFVREEIMLTDEKAFEMHEVDKEKIYEMINFLEEKELQEEELKKIEIRNNFNSPKDMQEFNKSIKEMQGELLTYLEDKGYIEKQEDNYTFNNLVLEKDNFESYADDFLSQSLEFKNDVFTKNFSAKNLVERFDLKLPDFKIYNNENGEMIYNSETREKAEDFEQFIVDKKGEEFWNNMNFSKSQNWESLIDDNSVTILSKTDKIYNDYSKFVFEEMDKKEFSSNVYEENIVYLENVRIDLVENSKENKMSKENYEKIKEKYLGTENKEIETKKVTKDDREIEM